tara:strand:- start:78 stop:389 length:312 start_codon:yes stop_codon:yes gene_type:complete
MIIYREDEDDWGSSRRALATPEEEVEHIRELANAIVETLYNEGAMSGKELKNRYGRAWHSTGNYSNKIIDMILFAHPNIAKIGNTKSRKYYYTEEIKEALPWW